MKSNLVNARNQRNFEVELLNTQINEKNYTNEKYITDENKMGSKILWNEKMNELTRKDKWGKRNILIKYIIGVL